MSEFNSQERIMAIVELLARTGRVGLPNKEIVVALQVSAPNICRDLGLLEKHRWIEKQPSGAWRLTPFFGNFSNLIAQSFREAKLRLAEDEERYRSAMQ
jgi:DNA-binding IclR family transcriptional regulator